MAKFIANGPVYLSWGGHLGDGTEHKHKFATSGMVLVWYIWSYHDIQLVSLLQLHLLVMVLVTGVTATGSGIMLKMVEH